MTAGGENMGKKVIQTQEIKDTVGLNFEVVKQTHKRK